MTWSEWLTLGNLILAVVIIGLIKGMPIHLLNRNLESFKGTLQKDIDKLRISGENIHPLKAEEYIQFANVYLKMMSSSKGNKRQQERINQEVVDGFNKFGMSIIFFGNDEAVKKFVEARKYITLPDELRGENEVAKTMILFSELIVIMRNDLGHENSSVSVDDFLMITLKDWRVSAEDFKRKASLAREVE